MGKEFKNGLKGRITPRISTVSSAGATFTPSLVAASEFEIDAQAADMLFEVPSDAQDGEVFTVAIKATGSTRNITYNSAYKPYGAALPTTLSTSKYTYFTVQRKSSTHYRILSALEQ